MQPPSKAILSRIYGHGRGWVFTPGHFADFSDLKVVNVILGRFQKKGTIRRIAHGLYDYPKVHSDLGMLSPKIESVIEALKSRGGLTFQQTGAYAANALGLSEQVPAKVVFLTNGKSRTIRIGKQVLHLKHTSTRKLQLAGTLSGLIVEALRYLGKNHITDRHLAKLSVSLPGVEKSRLRTHLRYTPIWMRPYLLRLIVGPVLA